MHAFIQGIRIELTADQIKLVEKEKRRRELCRHSFERMLKRFGFEKVDTSGWENPNQNCWQHIYYNWFVEIYDRNGWSDAWMVGTGLKDDGFPGGWCYSDPEEIEKELGRAIDEIEDKKINYG